jgi:hypothetical protein
MRTAAYCSGVQRVDKQNNMEVLKKVARLGRGPPRSGGPVDQTRPGRGAHWGGLRGPDLYPPTVPPRISLQPLWFK